MVYLNDLNAALDNS